MARHASMSFSPKTFRLMFACIITSPLIAGGCTIASRIKAYEGPTLPRDETAELVVINPVELLSLDGKPMPTQLFWDVREMYVTMLPGAHMAEVQYKTCRRGGGRHGRTMIIEWSDPVTIEFKARKGRRYYTRYEVDPVDTFG
jgi:hypothetical protein